MDIISAWCEGEGLLVYIISWMWSSWCGRLGELVGVILHGAALEEEVSRGRVWKVSLLQHYAQCAVC